MALADTIELARRREQAEAWSKGEAAVAAEVVLRAQLPPPPDLSEDDRKSLQPFVQWTTQKNARYCPAAPLTISAFVLAQAATGASTDKLLQQLDAIGRLHDRHNLANPCATWTARAALESVIQTDPPRSWTKAEQQAFVQLPSEVKAAISRREKDRERALRRTQNELAAMKRQNQTAPDAKPVIETKKEEVTHG